MTVPMLNTYCRRCHAAILSNAHVCPLCGLTSPNEANLSDIEKSYEKKPPVIEDRFSEMASTITGERPLIFQLFGLYRTYLNSKQDSHTHKIFLAIAFVMALFYSWSSLLDNKLYFLFMAIGIVALLYLAYDFISLFIAAHNQFMVTFLQRQGGTSPYSVHLKVETVLQNTLKSLQSLLYAYYEKPWNDLQNERDIVRQGDSYVQATKALTAKLKKFSKVSLETTTLLWRNNVYAITSYPNISYDDKIHHLNLKVTEAKALILRYCWLRQFDFAHEFLDKHIAVSKGTQSKYDKNFVIEGMQLGLMGPLTEPYSGTLNTVPYELPFIMRYFWHQRLPPGAFPKDEIISQFPETSELFESIDQVNNLISKLEEQKIINMATSSVASNFRTEAEITTEAEQIKRFELYSDYLDIPKFKPSDEELTRQVDRLNAELRV